MVKTAFINGLKMFAISLDVYDIVVSNSGTTCCGSENIFFSFSLGCTHGAQKNHLAYSPNKAIRTTYNGKGPPSYGHKVQRTCYSS